MTTAEWLESCQCIDIHPVNVTLGKYQFVGCRYVDPKHPDQSPSIYVVGKKPVFKKKACFLFGNDVWYICTYMDNFDRLPDHQKSYHPFGNNFIMKKWSSDHEIDFGERFRYERVEMQVSET